ncbi:hypothetical protein ACHAWF_001846 [Thalassiosira exigua]
MPTADERPWPALQVYLQAQSRRPYRAHFTFRKENPGEMNSVEVMRSIRLAPTTTRRVAICFCRTALPRRNHGHGGRYCFELRKEGIRRFKHPLRRYGNNAATKKLPAEASSVAGREAVPPATPPTARQLILHALRSMVPMIGFGFMDNSIMIHAGHYVDCTLGVTFGLSTLAAAGIGQIFSGIGGVVFGETLDAAFRNMSGSTKMTSAQRSMRASRIAGLTGGVVGVTLGCTLGLVNLLFVDEERASLLKLRALEEGQEFEFEVEVDNEVHPGYTTVTVRGPDVDGVLASITASIASIGCSVVELHASPRDHYIEEGEASSEAQGKSISSLLDHLVTSQTRIMEDVFLIRDRSTQQAIDNDDLDDLARTVLAAAKDPLNSHSLKAQVDDLQMENLALADRVSVLEGMLDDYQIKVRRSKEKARDDAR